MATLNTAQLQQQLNQINEYLKNLPETIKNAPQDEQIAYIAFGTGLLFFILGILLSFVL